MILLEGLREGCIDRNVGKLSPVITEAFTHSSVGELLSLAGSQDTVCEDASRTAPSNNTFCDDGNSLHQIPTLPCGGPWRLLHGKMTQLDLPFRHCLCDSGNGGLRVKTTYCVMIPNAYPAAAENK